MEMDKDLITLLSHEVSEELKDKDFSKILQQRNKVLVNLMEMKNKTDLP